MSGSLGSGITYQRPRGIAHECTPVYSEHVTRDSGRTHRHGRTCTDWRGACHHCTRQSNDRISQIQAASAELAGSLSQKWFGRNFSLVHAAVIIIGSPSICENSPRWPLGSLRHVRLHVLCQEAMSMRYKLSHPASFTSVSLSVDSVNTQVQCQEYGSTHPHRRYRQSIRWIIPTENPIRHVSFRHVSNVLRGTQRRGSKQ